MGRRTQVVRPTLCDCVLEQEWDDADKVPKPRTLGFGQRCSRHNGLTNNAAVAAVEEESRRFNAVAAQLEQRGHSLDGVSGRMVGDTLEVALPEGVALPQAAGVRFR